MAEAGARTQQQSAGLFAQLPGTLQGIGGALGACGLQQQTAAHQPSLGLGGGVPPHGDTVIRFGQ